MKTFIDPKLVLEDWETLRPFYDELVERSIQSSSGFLQWLKDKSELDAYVEEQAAWRYIRMTIDTRDEALTNAYTSFVKDIQPNISLFEDTFNKKMVASPFFDSVSSEPGYGIYFRSVKTAIELFRNENVPIEAEINEKSQYFGSISAAQTIEHEGEQLTMQKASSLLKEQDVHLRELIFGKIAHRRREDITKLHDLYSELISLRHKVAVQAGFDNFRDYKFKALGRFDYTKEDCFAFHRAVKEQVVPIVKEIQLKRLDKLAQLRFRPWDLDVDPGGQKPLKPFTDGRQLLDGTLDIFLKLDPFFHECLSEMSQRGYLDLESKNGKAPGGYNYPLYMSGYPFIFMNAVGTQQDLVTMVHEGGHAVHSVLSSTLELTAFKNLTSEVAELASMSMELLSMPHWDVFYKNTDELKRAKKDQLESIIKILPWIAQIDAFQHWVYEHPDHTVEQRNEKWLELSHDFGTGLIDWTGFEDMREISWQRQLHLFEVPFYYIEYGIAQLGALGVWKNAMENRDKAMEQYKNALRLGYSVSIPEVYKTAGVRFDFSSSHIGTLMSFVKEQLSLLD
jgi:oligoendopeptidase F